MGILTGNPKKQPLHYGEVVGVWGYFLSKSSIVSGYQTLINHCGDNELRSVLEDFVRTSKQESEQVEEVLKINGVALPPTPPEKANANLEAIPAGARFGDQEIAAMLSREIALGLVACSQVIGQSTREDIAAMFAAFHTTCMQYGLRMLRLSKEKGWLVHPPLYAPTPEPVNV